MKKYYLTFFLVVFLFYSCEKRDKTILPVVSTLEVTNISTTAITLNGIVEDEGETAVTQRGFCWAKNPNASASDNLISKEFGPGSFSEEIRISKSTNYYINTFAVNSKGTSYGNEIVFNTNDYLPSVQTSSVYQITSSTAICGGYGITNGGIEIIQKGIILSTDSRFDSNHQTIEFEGGDEDFSYTLTELQPNTIYFIKAFVRNKVGYGFGATIDFKTDITENMFRDMRDLNAYNKVSIGNQTWMSDNLNYKITNESSANSNKIYGQYYSWDEAVNRSLASNSNPSGIKGICPDGWHLPSVAEWQQLEDFLTQNNYGYEGSGNDIAKALASKEHWASSTTKGTIGNSLSGNNSSGFNAVPGGYLFQNVSSDKGKIGGYWTASGTESPDVVQIAELSNESKFLVFRKKAKTIRASVRCIKD